MKTLNLKLTEETSRILLFALSRWVRHQERYLEEIRTQSLSLDAVCGEEKTLEDSYALEGEIAYQLNEQEEQK